MNREVIEEMRLFYPRGPHPRPFLFTNSSRLMDEELLSWADTYLRPQLDPCVKRVVEFDNNDKDYISILREPFILNKDIMSGAYPLWGVALAYNLLRSPNPATKGNGGVVTLSLGQSEEGSKAGRKKAGHTAPEDLDENVRTKPSLQTENHNILRNSSYSTSSFALLLQEMPSPCPVFSLTQHNDHTVENWSNLF